MVMTFESMFRAIYGYDPFPWQAKAARCLMERKPLAAVNVPTASGKTAMIDAAVYAAAHGGVRRIAFIIDRRVVVDEAYRRANQVAEALKDPSMAELADQLGEIQVVRLRGGVHGDDDWVLYPDKLTIIISTVDQVGSRLLHRGYGVSSRMAPLHAGFVGNDILYIIDEAHLSMPFIETVESARRYGADIRLICMTATPVADTDMVVDLSAKDRAHSVLRKRLQANKQAKLLLVPKEESFVKRVVEEAQMAAESSRVIGIVVNRVSSARDIRQALSKASYRAELLTGRIRPYDRDRLMERVLPEICAGRDREEGDPLFIVATQTIEVGADLDFDALLTEAAPLDALRQRFGRLDRLGELGNTNGVILYRPVLDKKGKALSDPIYGNSIQDTWEWLLEVANKECVDFGVSAMEEHMRKVKPPVVEPQHAPVLLPPHINLLLQTGPEAPYVDVSPWLHGAQCGSADVSLVWRADLNPISPDLWEETVQLRPPLSREALEIPVYAARSWLNDSRMQEVSDLEGIDLFIRARGDSDRPVLIWRGPDDCQLGIARDIRPGDTVVIPSRYGGCDRYGWSPKSQETVSDIADYCSLERQRNHIVRLVPELNSWLGDSAGEIQEAVVEVVASETEVDQEVGVDQDRVTSAHETLRRLLGEVDHPLIKVLGGKYEIELHPFGVVLRGRIIDEVRATLNSGVAIELDQHLAGVEQLVDELGSVNPERERLVRAARQHDLGKAEQRFQTMLHGNVLTAAAGPVLAKSGMRKLSQLRASYAMSGLPRGFRHELASLDQSLTPGTLEEDTLVRYLIAAHHGYGRPWFPACADPNAPGVDQVWLGSGWTQAFISLLEEYGPWKLAGMELLLRASDARQSKAEQETGYV
ncbi:type I-U CRISPR-associated helicase/endonuclease Cas3 [Thermodesulfobacteriota bacterium]